MCVGVNRLFALRLFFLFFVTRIGGHASRNDQFVGFRVYIVESIRFVCSIRFNLFLLLLCVVCVFWFFFWCGNCFIFFFTQYIDFKTSDINLINNKLILW